MTSKWFPSTARDTRPTTRRVRVVSGFVVRGGALAALVVYVAACLPVEWILVSATREAPRAGGCTAQVCCCGSRAACACCGGDETPNATGAALERDCSRRAPHSYSGATDFGLHLGPAARGASIPSPSAAWRPTARARVPLRIDPEPPGRVPIDPPVL